MLKKWFGKKEETVRKLERPEDLKVGDMFELVDSFGLPRELRGQSFRIAEINSYEYQHEKETEFLLEGPSGEAFHMTIENDDGERWVNFTVKVERDEVESLFDMDAFSQVFDEEPGNPVINVVNESNDYERWLAESYRIEGDWSRGYFHKGDYRSKTYSKYEEDEKGEPFECVSLVSDDDMHSVEISVWSDGETEVNLCVTRPIADIKELYGKTST
ncbi:hypothetical protein [Aliikangiella coralliicola]|uniref:DUF4178 domain-containing protein n=1 Tax=Aliikangiella coralliicola TaxID=2592383 RepID=A0A545UGD2_9GAMM|nr:hypothetical protein [Aliikangiella coralliicola]TQV88517.1 hypothetical protein FLL46_08320 [Aliikangiella coralliicola]